MKNINYSLFYAQESSPIGQKMPKIAPKPKKALSKKGSPPEMPSHEGSPSIQTTNQIPTPPKMSLTPKVVFKGAKPKLSSGPKFKITPTRNGIPGQIQKPYSKGKIIKENHRICI